MTKCDRCQTEADWLVYAAHNVLRNERFETLVVHYPAPMIRSCDAHLAEALAEDIDHVASTEKWLVTPAHDEPGNL